MDYLVDLSNIKHKKQIQFAGSLDGDASILESVDLPSEQQSLRESAASEQLSLRESATSEQLSLRESAEFAEFAESAESKESTASPASEGHSVLLSEHHTVPHDTKGTCRGPTREQCQERRLLIQNLQSVLSSDQRALKKRLLTMLPSPNNLKIGILEEEYNIFFTDLKAIYSPEEIERYVGICGQANIQPVLIECITRIMMQESDIYNKIIYIGYFFNITHQIKYLDHEDVLSTCSPFINKLSNKKSKETDKFVDILKPPNELTKIIQKNSNADKEQEKDCYDNIIRYNEEEIHEIIKNLKKEGIADNFLFIIAIVLYNTSISFSLKKYCIKNMLYLIYTLDDVYIEIILDKPEVELLEIVEHYIRKYSLLYVNTSFKDDIFKSFKEKTENLIKTKKVPDNYSKILNEVDVAYALCGLYFPILYENYEILFKYGKEKINALQIRTRKFFKNLSLLDHYRTKLNMEFFLSEYTLDLIEVQSQSELLELIKFLNVDSQAEQLKMKNFKAKLQEIWTENNRDYLKQTQNYTSAKESAFKLALRMLVKHFNYKSVDFSKEAGDILGKLEKKVAKIKETNDLKNLQKERKIQQRILIIQEIGRFKTGIILPFLEELEKNIKEIAEQEKLMQLIAAKSKSLWQDMKKLLTQKKEMVIEISTKKRNGKNVSNIEPQLLQVEQQIEHLQATIMEQDSQLRPILENSIEILNRSNDQGEKISDHLRGINIYKVSVPEISDLRKKLGQIKTKHDSIMQLNIARTSKISEIEKRKTETISQIQMYRLENNPTYVYNSRNTVIIYDEFGEQILTERSKLELAAAHVNVRDTKIIRRIEPIAGTNRFSISDTIEVFECYKIEILTKLLKVLNENSTYLFGIRLDTTLNKAFVNLYGGNRSRPRQSSVYLGHISIFSLGTEEHEPNIHYSMSRERIQGDLNAYRLYLKLDGNILVDDRMCSFEDIMHGSERCPNNLLQILLGQTHMDMLIDGPGSAGNTHILIKNFIEIFFKIIKNKMDDINRSLEPRLDAAAVAPAAAAVAPAAATTVTDEPAPALPPALSPALPPAPLPALSSALPPAPAAASKPGGYSPYTWFHHCY